MGHQHQPATGCLLLSLCLCYRLMCSAIVIVLRQQQVALDSRVHVWPTAIYSTACTVVQYSYRNP
jgi:hypothetical protein